MVPEGWEPLPAHPPSNNIRSPAAPPLSSHHCQHLGTVRLIYATGNARACWQADLTHSILSGADPSVEAWRHPSQPLPAPHPCPRHRVCYFSQQTWEHPGAHLAGRLGRDTQKCPAYLPWACPNHSPWGWSGIRTLINPLGTAVCQPGSGTNTRHSNIRDIF